MTDQTPQAEPATARTSSFLSESERRKIEQLTEHNKGRFGADAQNQAVLERAKRLFRLLFMRLDHGRWRISKTKGLALAIAGVATLAFWNYYPRPHLETALDGPGLPIGLSATRPPTAQPMPTRPGQPLGPHPDVAVTAPPRLPAPRLEPASVTTPSQASTVSSAPSYDPYQSEPTRPPSSTAPINVKSPPSFVGWGATPNPDGARLPWLGETRQATPASPRVAPAPTALVQRPFVSSQVPKPLVDREATPKEPVDGNAPPETNPEARADANASPLGEVGVLVDAPTNASGPNEVSTNSTAPNQSNGVLFDASPAPAKTSGNSGVPSSQTVPQAASLFQPGARVGAKLAVGVIAVQGQESPVIAQLEGGAIAFGKASLNASGRVQISLLEVVKDGVSSAVNGSVIGADGFPGVSVELHEDSPDVVGQLWQAGLQGVSSYAQSVIQGASTTFAGGATTVSGPQPNLGLSLLQGLAQTFLTPTNQTTVKYARLEPQTPFEILFMPPR